MTRKPDFIYAVPCPLCLSELRFQEFIPSTIPQPLEIATERRRAMMAVLGDTGMVPTILLYVNAVHALVSGAIDLRVPKGPKFHWRSSIAAGALPVNLQFKSFATAISFEQAMALTALAAGHMASAALAMVDPDEASLSAAAGHCARAAGIYRWVHQYTPLNVHQDLASANATMPEISKKGTEILEKLAMLGAQQVSYELAKRKKTGDALLARIAIQVADFASETLGLMSSDDGFAAVMNHCQGSAYLYAALAFSHNSRHALAREDYGVAEAWGKRAQANLDALREFLEGAPLPLLNTLMKREVQGITDELASIFHDNRNVYFPIVPPPSELPGCEGIIVKQPEKYVAAPDLTITSESLGQI